MATLLAEVHAWQVHRSAGGGAIDWRFTTGDARIKLKWLCPSMEE